MNESILLPIILTAPIIAAGICFLLAAPEAVLRFISLCATAETAAVAYTVSRVFAGAHLQSWNTWLFLDELSAYNLAVLNLTFLLSSWYALIYFRHEISSGSFALKTARRFGVLWLSSLSAMTLSLLSNNLGIMWVGIEATTLLTAFLISIHSSAHALEAMWKYLMMCSVGVAFAFIGTLLTSASAGHLDLGSSGSLLWTNLTAVSGSLNPELMKTAFIFLLVGYGTKAGLAPMHSWLPDAHSQAPAPVSAIFSGFLLSTALYCIMRYVPIVENALGNSGWCTDTLVFFGVLSILIAAPFVLMQHDGKRLLAYSSIEHMGIITLGIGLGGIGTFGALLHTLNHSLCKSLGFFSIGRLGQLYKTHDLTRIGGSLRASPVWGMGLFGSIIALIGVAPFALFLSEFQILKAAVDTRTWIVLTLFLLGTGVVFAGALKHGMNTAWGAPTGTPENENAGIIEKALVILPLALLVMLGLFIPDFLQQALAKAAIIIGGAR